MKIKRVSATPLSVPITLDAAGIEKKTSAGLANGGLVEYHYPAVKVCEAIYGKGKA